MLDCRHATQLASQAMEKRLSFRQRWALRFHLLLCDACTNFVQQLRQLRAAMGRISQYIENDTTRTLSMQARERIAAAMVVQARQNDEARRNPDHDMS